MIIEIMEQYYYYSPMKPQKNRKISNAFGNVAKAKCYK